MQNTTNYVKGLVLWQNFSYVSYQIQNFVVKRSTTMVVGFHWESKYRDIDIIFYESLIL